MSRYSSFIIFFIIILELKARWMIRKLRTMRTKRWEMKAMAEENRRLKRMYAEMSMQNDLLKEALGKKR